MSKVLEQSPAQNIQNIPKHSFSFTPVFQIPLALQSISHLFTLPDVHHELNS